jgi:hypothetical protein
VAAAATRFRRHCPDHQRTGSVPPGPAGASTSILGTGSAAAGIIVISGIPGRSLLDRIGATGASIDAVAVNDYLIVIPADDLRNKGAMLAFEMDGRPLTLREKGPLWIVYPRDDHPELASDNYNSRWIWQLNSLQIK